MTFATARRHRIAVAALLVMACVRVFAGVEGVEFHAHDTDAAAFEVALEHSHAANHGGTDPAQPHFHCHTGCVHAAMVSPAAPAMAPAAPVALTTTTESASPTHPVFAHFRPPRA